MDDHFSFVPPSECPVFRPTKEEFNDPLEYIEQISPIAVKTGICKIIPPDDWRPPFSVNVDSFQFTPRVQKLYELEAQSRIKLNFMTKLSQCVQLQGSDKLKIPNINGKHLDLYKFHKLVQMHGGFDHVTSNKLWAKICNRLYPKMNYSPTILKGHYEKIVLPYERLVENTNSNGQFYNLSDVKPKPVLHPSTTKKRKSETLDCSFDQHISPVEFKRLQFNGAGPKIFTTVVKNESSSDSDSRSVGSLKRKCMSDVICKKCERGDRENELLICDNAGCDKNYHIDCLQPKLPQVPKQSWKCKDCVWQVLTMKPIEYGFPSSSVRYTLQNFGRSADRFKANYFAKQLHEITPCSLVEKEFWRILQSFNDDIIVEYGADIHSSHQGSGFPTLETINNGKCARNNDESDWSAAQLYSTESWNLNNLPVNKKSILRFIRGNIDGMKVPWCYVGMVFSSFCWHIEDHWSYSINYLHWGEPKTWYGVSSEEADKFERAMKKQAPELFENHPDLLHHITTIMNPNILQKEGISIYRTDQHAGQFVVTFPRAYHAGFNQGFNFAEAVNFCPANWLPKGRACVDHYAQLRRHCVFSHEELLCTIAEAAILEQNFQRDLKQEELENYNNGINPEQFPLMSGLGLPLSEIQLDTNIRRTVHAELKLVIEQEKIWRSQIKNLEITANDEPTIFECLKDDARACVICQTTCFMSAIQCCCINNDLQLSESDESGSSSNSSTSHHIKVKSELKSNELYMKIYCLRHLNDLCPNCTKSQLRFHYRFTIEQLEKLLVGLEIRLQDLHNWEDELQKYCGIQSSDNSIDSGIDIDKKLWSLDTLKAKLDEGAQCGFDTCQVYFKAKALLERGQNLFAVCSHWCRLVKNIDKTDFNFSIPKSVLVDCQDESGYVEVRHIDVANVSESNLYLVSQTVKMFPLTFSGCDEFVQMVDRMFEWRTQAYAVLDESFIGDPGLILSKVIRVFDDAKSLFPGWISFINERTVLMLLGRTLQWRVRIKEWEKKRPDVLKTGSKNSAESSLLPVSLLNEDTVNELLIHGKNVLVTINDSKVKKFGDLVTKYLVPLVDSIKASVSCLHNAIDEVKRIKIQISNLPRRSLTNALVESMKDMHRRCQTIGVRIKEFDEFRSRIYRSCIDIILASPRNGNGKLIDLSDAIYLLELGTNLFNEGVLNKSSEEVTQKHLAAKTQITLMNRSIRKLKCIFSHEHESDDRLLSFLLPRTLNSEPDAEFNNTIAFQLFWSDSALTEGHIVAILRRYQSMIVSELTFLNPSDTSVLDLSSDLGTMCSICGDELPLQNEPNKASLITNLGFCNKCRTKTKRPSISEIASINKILKQNSYVFSIYEIALQALSKRVVTWLESLVTVFRLKLPYLYGIYRRLPARFGLSDSIPMCIRDLFTNYQKSLKNPFNPPIIRIPKEDKLELVVNFRCLQRVGCIVEVNVDTYITLLSAFLEVIQNEIRAAETVSRFIKNS